VQIDYNYIMDTSDTPTTLEKTGPIPAKLKDGFLVALTARYGNGLRINQAFELPDTPDRTTYYRYLKSHADEMHLIDSEARETAMYGQSGEQMSFDAEQFLVSTELQRLARDSLAPIIEHMAELAQGLPYTMGSGDNERQVTPHPRDRVDAAKVVVMIAKEGVMNGVQAWTRGMERAISAGRASGKIEQKSLLPMLGVSPDFSRVEATKPDGTKLIAAVEYGADVIDSED